LIRPVALGVNALSEMKVKGICRGRYSWLFGSVRCTVSACASMSASVQVMKDCVLFDAESSNEDDIITKLLAVQSA